MKNHHNCYNFIVFHEPYNKQCMRREGFKQFSYRVLRFWKCSFTKLICETCVYMWSYIETNIPWLSFCNHCCLNETYIKWFRVSHFCNL